MSRKTIAQTLEEQRVLIFNSSKPEIAPLLEGLSADAAHLKKGKALYGTVISFQKNKKRNSRKKTLPTIIIMN